MGPGWSGRRTGTYPRTVAGQDFLDEGDHQYVPSVRAAVKRTFETSAYQPPEQVFNVLTEELRRRGVEPDAAAVFEAAALISRGRRPAVLNTT